MSKFIVFYLEVFVLFTIPILLLTISSRFLAIRHIFMAAGGIYCALRLIKSSATLGDLGFHKINFLNAISNLVFPSFILILMTIILFLFAPHNLLKVLVGLDSLSVQSFAIRILAYMFLSAPIQELIFRGYLTWRIKEVYTSKRMIEFISVTIFTLAHVPFYSPLMLLISFSMGIIYIKNYQKYQNIYASTISHALVGAVLIVVRNAWFPYS